MTTLNNEPSKPVIRTLVVADVKCYLCGTITGTVESDRKPLPTSVLFRKAGAEVAVPILDWRSLRCARCAGPIYLDDADIVVKRVESYNWGDERPRRGRPPKRLVEERRRERELMESRAA